VVDEIKQQEEKEKLQVRVHLPLTQSHTLALRTLLHTLNLSNSHTQLLMLLLSLVGRVYMDHWHQIGVYMNQLLNLAADRISPQPPPPFPTSALRWKKKSTK